MWAYAWMFSEKKHPIWNNWWPIKYWTDRDFGDEQ